MRIKGVVLKYNRHIPFSRPPVIHILAGNFDRTPVGLLQPRDAAQGGRFAGPGGSQQDKKFAILNIQAEIPNRGNIFEFFR
jgi:hypothetical protein